MQQPKKIECPHCVGFQKGVLFSITETTKGEIIGRCKRCGVFSTYNVDTGQFTKIEQPKK